jgi:hypothetical protein
MPQPAQTEYSINVKFCYLAVTSKTTQAPQQKLSLALSSGLTPEYEGFEEHGELM